MCDLPSAVREFGSVERDALPLVGVRVIAEESEAAMRSRIASTAIVGLIATPVWAQSINIDYGDGQGSPPAWFGAIGLPGQWNTLTGSDGIPEMLVDLDGEPVAATVATAWSIRTEDDESTGEPEERLMDDGVDNGSDVAASIRFGGLEAGDYRVVVYAWPPNRLSNATIVQIGEEGFLLFHLSDDWPGFVEGETHVIHELAITDSTLDVYFLGGIFGCSFLNGIQLYKIRLGDVDRDGAVGFSDVLSVLTSWGPCAGCPADVNDDGVVGFDDVVIVLANWS